MATNDPPTEQLLDRARAGSLSAVEQLLVLYRPRLRKMVAAQLDDRLAARFDPSDVVQEALVEATRRLAEYLEHRPVSFYPWLRGLALDRLTDLRRRHLGAARRSVLREEPDLQGPNRSAFALADRLLASVSSPSSPLQRQQVEARVREALDRLNSTEREILVLRYVEDCSTAEIAQLLNLSERTIRRGHSRALARLSPLLQDLTGE